MENNVVILIDDLRCSEVKKKVNAIQQLDKIATVLGPDRTNSELMPYIMEMIDDEDEVLMALATALAKFLPFVGGKGNMMSVIKPLETLATVEEGAVRDQACKSIRTILGQVKVKDFEDDLLQLISRLVKGDWFTSKTSAMAILPAIYPNVSSSGQKALFKLYAPLCADKISQVRKAAATALNQLILCIPKAPESELLELFETFQKDSQDMVKMQGVEGCINFAKTLSSSKINSYVVPYIKAFAEERSWRIRYLMATKMIEFANAFGKDFTKTKLVGHYVNFLKDPESEVRTAAASQLTEFVSFLDKDTILDKIIPTFKGLSEDSFAYVRVSLAENMLAVCPKIGKSQTNEHIIPLFLLFLRDTESEVRLAVFKKLINLNEVIGIDSLSQSIIPAISELSNDKNWRTRVSVVDMFPLLAEQLGQKLFDEKLSKMLLDWLTDPIFSIREQSMKTINDLGFVFGQKWIEDHVMPTLVGLENHENYLFRQIPLLAFKQMAPCINSEMYSDSIFPILSTFATDKVINIRMNVSKVIIEFASKLKGTDAEEKTVSLLNALKNDPEFDVSYFAKKALKKFK